MWVTFKWSLVDITAGVVPNNIEDRQLGRSCAAVGLEGYRDVLVGADRKVRSDRGGSVGSLNTNGSQTYHKRDHLVANNTSSTHS